MSFMQLFHTTFQESSEFSASFVSSKLSYGICTNYSSFKFQGFPINFEKITHSWKPVDEHIFPNAALQLRGHGKR